MPVIATPTQSTLLTRDEIRQFMRDFPGRVPNTGTINVLLDNVEFSDTDISHAIRFTVDNFNTMTPPLGQFTEGGIPPTILLYGVASHLLTMESVRQLRNQATVQDGDVQPIGIDDKTQLYQQAAERLRALYETYARQYKVALNMRLCNGGLSSGYLLTSRSLR